MTKQFKNNYFKLFSHLFSLPFPTCSSQEVNYYIEPLTKEKLESLLKKMKMTPGELLRKNERAYKELDIDSYNEGQLLELVLLDSDLIQRPIVEMGKKAILARLPGKIYELFE